MSKIALSGNASGTGTLTIAAPNTNSDISISLPTVTGGSFVVSDSSGNVGIGTSSPLTKFTVSGGYISQTDGTVRTYLGADGSGGALVGTTTNQYLRFTTNDTERGRFDTSGNFLMNSGYGSVAIAYGCRAWVNFRGSDAIIRGSGNVSSITRGGTGSYTVNFTTAMPDVNYFVGTGPVAIGSAVGALELGGYTTSAVSMTTRYSAGGAYDWDTVFINVFR